MTYKAMNNSGGFTAFSSAAYQAAGDVAEVRSQSTSDERTVLALEGIFDQLMLIHADLSSMDDFARGGGRTQGPAASTGNGAAMSSRHDGNRDQYDVIPGNPEILRSLHYSFSVGGYDYTDLQNAISEAKRVRRAALAEEAAKVRQ